MPGSSGGAASFFASVIGEHARARHFTAAWNALAPKRIAAIRHEDDAIRVLHPTKGWRRLSHKRLGLA